MTIVEEIEKLLNGCTDGSKIKQITALLYHTKLLSKYMQVEGYNLPNGARYYEDITRIESQLNIVTSAFVKLLPNYKNALEREYSGLFKKNFILDIHPLMEKDIGIFFEHCIDLLKIDLTGEKEIQSGNIFLGIDEKLERAQKSVRDGNPEGSFSNFHTIIELLLKDKLGIALNMEDARLGKVIGICIRNNVFEGKNSILEQLDKKACKIDNAIKHKGYNPTATEINDALLITMQAVRVLKNENAKLTPELKEEISKILLGK